MNSIALTTICGERQRDAPIINKKPVAFNSSHIGSRDCSTAETVTGFFACAVDALRCVMPTLTKVSTVFAVLRLRSSPTGIVGIELTAAHTLITQAQFECRPGIENIPEVDNRLARHSRLDGIEVERAEFVPLG
jgi:hypothetical protein